MSSEMKAAAVVVPVCLLLIIGVWWKISQDAAVHVQEAQTAAQDATTKKAQEEKEAAVQSRAEQKADEQRRLKVDQTIQQDKTVWQQTGAISGSAVVGQSGVVGQPAEVGQSRTIRRVRTRSTIVQPGAVQPMPAQAYGGGQPGMR